MFIEIGAMMLRCVWSKRKLFETGRGTRQRAAAWRAAPLRSQPGLVPPQESEWYNRFVWAMSEGTCHAVVSREPRCHR